MATLLSRTWLSGMLRFAPHRVVQHSYRAGHSSSSRMLPAKHEFRQTALLLLRPPQRLCWYVNHPLNHPLAFVIPTNSEASRVCSCANLATSPCGDNGPRGGEELFKWLGFGGSWILRKCQLSASLFGASWHKVKIAVLQLRRAHYSRSYFSGQTTGKYSQNPSARNPEARNPEA